MFADPGITLWWPIHAGFRSCDAQLMAPLPASLLWLAVLRVLRVAVASGAVEVGTLQQGAGTCEVDPSLGVNDPAFVAYCEKVRQLGVKSDRCGLFSAHQMGTCKMGTSAARSVVDPDGQAWELHGDGIYRRVQRAEHEAPFLAQQALLEALSGGA